MRLKISKQKLTLILIMLVFTLTVFCFPVSKVLAQNYTSSSLIKFAGSVIPDGNHNVTITGIDEDGKIEIITYAVEVINYTDDVHYSLEENQTSRVVSLGDNSDEYKMLIVKYHKNLTIDNGVTVTANTHTTTYYENREYELTYKKGMLIYVGGTLINNGTISMTARGTYNQAGENVYLMKNSNGTFEYIPAVGGAGAQAVTGTYAEGINGTAGVGRQTGGGGSGALEYQTSNPPTKTSGAGSTGTSYSGGSGGASVFGNVTGVAEPAGENGGKGGDASINSSYDNYSMGGGAGNPGGRGKIGSTYDSAYDGETGTGGLLIIKADEINNNGSITSEGSKGGVVTAVQSVGGSGSGGGSINIFYNNSINQGTESVISADGGKQGVTTTSANVQSGKGGAGTINISSITEYGNSVSSLYSSAGKISPSFEENITSYNLILEKFVYEYDINVESEGVVVGAGTFEIDFGETQIRDITITDSEGNSKIYTVTVTRKTLVPGEHSSKLTSISIDGYENELSPSFKPLVYSYDLTILPDVEDLDINYKTLDETATVSITGEKELGENDGIITLLVTAPGEEDTTYEINYIRQTENIVNNYSYTGDVQIFEAPCTGIYKLEVWGAQGGGNHQNGNTGIAGKGGYSAGNIYLKKNQTLYVYVGGAGAARQLYGTIAGGYNGGGYGWSNTGGGSDVPASGGGATDIRTVKASDGSWYDLNHTSWIQDESLLSRFIVAGGGGGGGMDVERAGSGGGTSGVTRYGAGGTQTSGYAFGKGADATSANGANSRYGGPGAGGGWYGGNLQSWYGAGGGSGFILVQDSLHNTPSGYLLDKQYFLSNATTINGDTSMPNHDGTGTMTGNDGNGYAKITLLSVSSGNNYLSSISSKNGVLSPEFNKKEVNYDLIIPKYDNIFDISCTADNVEAEVMGCGEYNLERNDSKTIDITVTAGNGNIRIYKVTAKREKMATGEHSSKLKHLEMSGISYKIEINPQFLPNVYEYNIDVHEDERNVKVKYALFDSEATVHMTGNVNMDESGVIEINVSAPGVEDTVYRINYSKTFGSISEFNYTGSYQTFVAPCTGDFLLEVWGAQGGGGEYATYPAYGGNGGYSKGELHLEKGETLYIYVGGKGLAGSGTITGGWNGGNNTEYHSGHLYGSGGGATDIRLISGDWNDSESLVSRFIVAGGGGGGHAETSRPSHSRGGVGGGSTRASCIVGRNTCQGAPGGGWTNNGISGNGGSYGQGGAGFVYTEDMYKVIPEGYVPTERYYLGEAETISGNQAIPTHDGLSTMTGNTGDGYAKITLIKKVSDNNLLLTLESDRGTFNKEFVPEDENYTLNLTKYDEYFTLTGELQDEYSRVDGLGKYYIANGESKDIEIMVMAENGTANIYTIHATREDFAENEHTSKLKKLDVYGKDYMPDMYPTYYPLVTEYNIDIGNSESKLYIDFLPYDEEATVVIEGNENIGETGTITITVHEPHVDDTVYTLNYTKTFNDYEVYDYTGDYQTFTAPFTGKYKLEVWGAQGGGNTFAEHDISGGSGGYSKGIVNLNKGEKIYVYVGARGGTGGGFAYGGWNGGNNTEVHDGHSYGAGGGATDIRLVPGEWNDETSLLSRIIVAGGGGGGHGESSMPSYSKGGAGGGVEGIKCSGSIAYGSEKCLGAAGGGWNDGTVGAGGSLGHGGSGFIFTEESENLPKGYIPTEKYYLLSAETIAGNQTVPTHDGEGTMTGNLGNGYAKVSSIIEEKDRNNYLASLSSDRGTFNKIFNPLIFDYELTISEYDDNFMLDGSLQSDFATVTGLGRYEISKGEVINIEIAVLSESGDTRVYRVKVSRNEIDTEHTSLLRSLNVDGYKEDLLSDFSPNKKEYNINIFSTEINLNITAIPYDIEATYEISGNEHLMDDNGVITITVMEPNVENTVYRIYYTKKNVDAYEYSYTGNYQTYVVPFTGEYRLEVWGAQGGISGGYGGYSVGDINLSAGEILYIYSGGTTSDCTPGWNGGGSGNSTSSGRCIKSGGGGGATHIAKVEGVLSSLNNNRGDILIVAGGGGGSDIHNHTGGAGGGKVGAPGYGNYVGYGGTQESGGGYYQYGYEGSFGSGGSSTSNTSDRYYPGAGGGGYYGGGSGGHGEKNQAGAGGGGSGYIGNENLFNKKMVMYSSNTSYVSDEYSTKTEITTNVSEDPVSNYAKSGSGYAKITPLFDYVDMNNYLSSLSVSTGSLAPSFDPLETEYKLYITEDSVDITAEPSSNRAIVLGTGTYNTNETDIITISVTSESGDERLYEIEIIKHLNSDTSLNSFVPSVGELSPSFDNSINTYNIVVPVDTELLDIDIVPNSSKTTIDGNDNIILDQITQEQIIKVTAEDGTQRLIKVTIDKDVSITEFVLRKERVELIKPETYQISTVPSSPDEFNYESMNEEVLTVDENGFVTTLSEGTTKVLVSLKADSSIQRELTVVVLSNRITSNIYSVRDIENENVDSIIIGSEEGITIGEFISNLDNPPELLSVYDENDVKLTDDEIVRTGLIVRLEKNNLVYDDSVIIVRGDVDGTGIIDVTDESMVLEDILSLESIEGYGRYAADVLEDEILDVSDESNILDYILQLLNTLNS